MFTWPPFIITSSWISLLCVLSSFVTTLEEHRAITLLCSGTEQNPFNPQEEKNSELFNLLSSRATSSKILLAHSTPLMIISKLTCNKKLKVLKTKSFKTIASHNSILTPKTNYQWDHKTDWNVCFEVSSHKVSPPVFSIHTNSCEHLYLYPADCPFYLPWVMLLDLWTKGAEGDIWVGQAFKHGICYNDFNCNKEQEVFKFNLLLLLLIRMLPFNSATWEIFWPRVLEMIFPLLPQLFKVSSIIKIA